MNRVAMLDRPQSPAALPDWPAAAAAVIAAGRRCAARGWTPATSGNFSVRASDGQVAITCSGVDKGELAVADLLRQPMGQAPLPGASAEAGLHIRLYAERAELGAVFHIHSVAASVLGRRHAGRGQVVLEGWELQKALRGVPSHETPVSLPVFDNTQDIAALADEVTARFAAPADAEWLAPGYLIAGHGLYAWGVDAAEAWRHLEALETLLASVFALRN